MTVTNPIASVASSSASAESASSLQRHFWLLQQLTGSSSPYHVQAAVEVSHVSAEQLRLAAEQCLRSHEATRQILVEREGVIQRQLLSPEQLHVDQRSLLPGDVGGELNDLLGKPFDLARGPNVRAAVLSSSTTGSHLLVLVAHQACVDEDSLLSLQQEVLVRLQGQSPSGSLPLAELDALHQRWNEERGEAARQAFRSWIPDPNGFLDIPLAAPRPTPQAFTAGRARQRIEQSVWQRIAEGAARLDVTPEQLLLAGFAALLTRYAATPALRIGFDCSLRAQQDGKAQLGSLTNTLPLCLQVDTSQGLAALAQQVARSTRALSEQGQLALPDLVEALSPARDGSYHPLYQVSFVHRRLSVPYCEGISCRALAPGFSGACPWDLKLALEEIAQPASEPDQQAAPAPQRWLTLDYCDQLFDPGSMQRLLSHLLELLADGCEHPEKSLATLQLLTPKEVEQQLSEWNQTEAELPKRQSLQALFEAQVVRAPDRIAVVFERRSLTYAELDKKANQLAHFLRGAGVGPNVLVAVCLERSEWMLISLLGILKAGGGYVPLDPEYPSERIQYIADHSQTPWLLTQQSLLERLPDTQARVFCIDRDWSQVEQAALDAGDGPPEDRTSPTDLAYVIYTSGSTGKPKGVQVPQGAVVNFICSMAHTPGMHSRDVLVAVTTLCFDIAVLELYLPLAVGARTVIASREDASDGVRLLALLERSGATLLQATPATWFILLDAGLSGKKIAALCGGEALPRDLARRLVPRTRALWNMYGPTETTVWSTCQQIIDPEAPILIGRPIDNTTLYVLDENLQPVAVGLPGELHIGGLGVTHGYLHRDDLTRERFIDDPFSQRPGARLYKTGDAVRRTADGNLEYLHRLDNQVKVRGFRIELGEIESVLVQHPALAQNVVVVREDRPGDKRLVCYFVTKDEAEAPSERALREHASASLPSYMVPQHFVCLPELPQTPNGKVDRKALPAPQLDSEQQAYELPSDFAQLPEARWQLMLRYQESPLSASIETMEVGSWLLLEDDAGILRSFARTLEELGHQVVRVQSGDTYAQLGKDRFSVNPEQGYESFQRLVSDLNEQGKLPSNVVHGFLLTAQERYRPGSSLFHRNQEHGYHTLRYLYRALNQLEGGGKIHFALLTNGAAQVASEPLPYPGKATAIGAANALSANASGHTFATIDVDLPTEGAINKVSPRFVLQQLRTRRLQKLLEKELLIPAHNRTVAYRGERRLRLTQERGPVPRPDGDAPATAEGLVAIVGGLGRRGLQLAQWYAEQPNARLLLLDQKAPPDQSHWQELAQSGDFTAARLLQLEATGAPLQLEQVDAADSEELRSILQRAVENSGPLRGVIYTARGYAPCSSHSEDEEAIFEAQVQGPRVLSSVLEEHHPRFVCYLSGLREVLGAEAQAASAAAEAYLRALSLSAGGADCVQWIGMSEWQSAKSTSTGATAANEQSAHSALSQLETLSAELGPTPEQACSLLQQLIGHQSQSCTRICSVDVEAYRQELTRAARHQARQQKVLPRDEVERALASMWQRILGLSEVGVHDNFFEVGGHSLTAVRLFGEIQAAYNVDWPLAVLFEAPTIEACAARIRSTRAGGAEAEPQASLRYLVTLHPGPDACQEPPVFIVAGAFGNVLNLRHLALLLGKERRVYGVQARGLLGDDQPHETFEEMAHDYLEEIRTVQPQGPYVLAGFCSGGTAAYEMARQLEQAGEKVSHLILMDATSPAWVESPLTKREKAQAHLERLRDEGARYPVRWARGRYRFEKQRLKERLYGKPKNQGTALFRSAAIFDATKRAEERYDPGVWRGHAALYRPRLDRRHIFGPDRAVNAGKEFVRHDNGWAPHLPGLLIEEVAADAGDHDGFVLEPAVRDLARRVRRFLAT